eukprot:TRINITY_DN7288_c4_g1_i2.p4 TRINITY_DN7288_c4_g1~~TRINITY_DN7288_c4_g1_i2.p4  ORF type:complete len:111 (+),score=2.25 TRINITY_DN7288_c4_g1_i2:437-769(+)
MKTQIKCKNLRSKLDSHEIIDKIKQFSIFYIISFKFELKIKNFQGQKSNEIQFYSILQHSINLPRGVSGRIINVFGEMQMMLATTILIKFLLKQDEKNYRWQRHQPFAYE